jgi:Protein of unknown function (DUF3570)
MRRALAALALLLAGPARADDLGEARAAVRLFAEPAPSQSLIVVSPAVSARVAPLRWLGIRAAWDADVVTGATPRVYGSPDAVSAATRFSDVRNTLTAEAEGRFGPVALRAGYRYGTENDYRSHVILAGASVDLFQKNTTVAASWSHNFDSVCNLDDRAAPPTLRQSLGVSDACFTGHAGLTEEPLAIDAADLTLTQVVTARLLVRAAVSYEHLSGFQSNPYRRVRLAGGLEAQESHPLARDRGALALRARYAVPPARAAIALDLRGYRDSWGVMSYTIETAWDQLLSAKRLRLRLRTRYYQQSRASFYRDAGEADSYERAGPPGRYFTGDRELAPFADLLVGARLSFRFEPTRLLHAFDLAAGLDAIKAFAFTPEPPNAPRMTGVVDALSAGLSLSGSF